MGACGAAGLNDSGEHAATCIVTHGATHTSRSQRTTEHGHYAWKLHVGMDAGVWVTSPERAIHGPRVVVVPPNVHHATGALGWSVALFLEPGTRGTPLRAGSGVHALEGARAERLVALCREASAASRPDMPAFVDAVARAAFGSPVAPRVDARVGAALAAIRADVDVDLNVLARRLGLSLDRLTHIVSTATGMPPRRHALWRRVLRVLEAGAQPATLAAAALDAGFADHAHMTRSFRRFLGRVPSEFRAPPIIVAPWYREGGPANAPARRVDLRP